MRDIVIDNYSISYTIDYCDKFLRKTGSERKKYELKKKMGIYE